MKRHKEATPEQRKEILARVEQVRKSEGLSLQEAWDKEGRGHITTYYTWKKGGKKAPKQRRPRIQVEQTPAPQPHIVAHFVLFSDGNIANLADLKRSA